MDPEYFRAKAFVHLISGSPKETLAVSIKLCKWVSYGEENVVSLNVSNLTLMRTNGRCTK